MLDIEKFSELRNIGYNKFNEIQKYADMIKKEYIEYIKDFILSSDINIVLLNDYKTMVNDDYYIYCNTLSVEDNNVILNGRKCDCDESCENGTNIKQSIAELPMENILDIVEIIGYVFDNFKEK